MVPLALRRTPAGLQSIMHREYVPNWRRYALVSVSLSTEGAPIQHTRKFRTDLHQHQIAILTPAVLGTE